MTFMDGVWLKLGVFVAEVGIALGLLAVIGAVIGLLLLAEKVHFWWRRRR